MTCSSNRPPPPSWRQQVRQGSRLTPRNSRPTCNEYPLLQRCHRLCRIRRVARRRRLRSPHRVTHSYRTAHRIRSSPTRRHARHRRRTTTNNETIPTRSPTRQHRTTIYQPLLHYHRITRSYHNSSPRPSSRRSRSNRRLPLTLTFTLSSRLPSMTFSRRVSRICGCVYARHRADHQRRMKRVRARRSTQPQNRMRVRVRVNRIGAMIRMYSTRMRNRVDRRRKIGVDRDIKKTSTGGPGVMAAADAAHRDRRHQNRITRIHPHPTPTQTPLLTRIVAPTPIHRLMLLAAPLVGRIPAPPIAISSPPPMRWVVDHIRRRRLQRRSIRRVSLRSKSPWRPRRERRRSTRRERRRRSRNNAIGKDESRIGAVRPMIIVMVIAMIVVPPAVAVCLFRPIVAIVAPPPAPTVRLARAPAPHHSMLTSMSGQQTRVSIAIIESRLTRARHSRDTDRRRSGTIPNTRRRCADTNNSSNSSSNNIIVRVQPMCALHRSQPLRQRVMVRRFVLAPIAFTRRHSPQCRPRHSRPLTPDRHRSTCVSQLHPAFGVRARPGTTSRTQQRRHTMRTAVTRMCDRRSHRRRCSHHRMDETECRPRQINTSSRTNTIHSINSCIA